MLSWFAGLFLLFAVVRVIFGSVFWIQSFSHNSLSTSSLPPYLSSFALPLGMVAMHHSSDGADDGAGNTSSEGSGTAIYRQEVRASIGPKRWSSSFSMRC